MKLSNETLSVLKNFATINEGIKFKQGTTLTTVSGSKTVLAEAELKDDFPQDFCVYDLNEFLSVHSLFKDKVEIDFEDKNIVFRNGSKKIKYRMAAEDTIVSAPSKRLTLPTEDVKFTLTDEDYHWIMDTAKVLGSPNIAVKSDGDKIEVVTFDVDNDAAHDNSLQIGDGNGKKYKMVFKTDNFKMVPGTYEVTISFKGITHFKNTKENIQYWIASEAKYSQTGE